MKANPLEQQAKFRGIPISTHQNTPKQAKLRTKTRFKKQPPTQDPTNASKIARITPSPIHINALLLYFSRNTIALHIDLWEQHAFSL